jgi:NAD(P)-dependent dehydrogenase (short-subunit alcohol dehydrogenase family)
MTFRQNFVLPDLQEKLDALNEGGLLQITQNDYERLFGANDVTQALAQFCKGSRVCGQFASGAILFRKALKKVEDRSAASKDDHSPALKDRCPSLSIIPIAPPATFDASAGWSPLTDVETQMASKTKAPYSRRAVVGAGATLAAASMTSASVAKGDQSSNAVPLMDPTGKYPKPPFKKQSQVWPGLASQMDPPPDHGEHSYRGSGRLAGRKALITGGDSGMGRAAAIAFAREGADVAINYFPTEEPDAREVIGLIRAEERKGLALPGDIREEEFCRELVRRTVEGLGGLDLVVSNAARQQARQSILDVSSEDFDATMKTNIYAPFWIIKAALPHLKPGSVIIATSSEQAYDPSPDLYDYAQTKAATMNFVKSLAKQLGPKGIRVNGVAPGPIWTPLQVSGGASMEKLEKFGSQTSFGRPGQPAELGSIYVQLAAADASFATGQIYGSAGGTGQP